MQKFLLFCYIHILGGDVMTADMVNELDRRKRILKRYKRNAAMIDRLAEKLEELNNKIYSLNSPSLSDMPRGGEPVQVEDLIADKLILEQRIERLKVKGQALRSELMDLIDNLDDPRYAEILERFFIDREDFETIANETGYTVRHVIRLYSEGILSMSL